MLTGFFPGAPLGNAGHTVLAAAAGDAVIVPPSGILRLDISVAGTTNLVPTFDRGDRVMLRAVVTDAITTDRVAAPGLIVSIRKPKNVRATVVPIEESPGVYTATLTIDAEGKWRYRWEADGASEEGMFVAKTNKSD